MTSLQDLIDERAIREALAHFARILDRKQWGRLHEVFAEDLTYDYGDGQDRRGIDSLREHIRRFLDVCGNTQHLIGSVLVEVDGNQAISHSYVQARHQGRAEQSVLFFDANGEYIDHWERRAQGWRIARREAIWQMHMGDPSVLSASAESLQSDAPGTL